MFEKFKCVHTQLVLIPTATFRERKISEVQVDLVLGLRMLVQGPHLITDTP